MAKCTLEANGGFLAEDIIKQYVEAFMEYLEAALSYPMVTRIEFVSHENRVWVDDITVLCLLRVIALRLARAI